MRAAELPASGHRRILNADGAMAAVILALGLLLAGAGGSFLQRWRMSPARQQSLGFEDQLGIAANIVGLIVVAWWALSLVAAVAAAMLERNGSGRAASAAGKFAPTFMRRLALAAVGVQLVTAPLATASPAAEGPGAPAPAVSAGWTPTAMLPAAAGSPQAAAAPSVHSPDPGTPAGPAAAPADQGPQWRPLGPVIEPGPLAGPPLRSPQPAGQATEVTVRPGDSLWSLSAAHLGPFSSDVDIAVEWPRLYQANRDVIGGNPHLLRPGQVLRFPAGQGPG